MVNTAASVGKIRTMAGDIQALGGIGAQVPKPPTQTEKSTQSVHPKPPAAKPQKPEGIKPQPLSQENLEKLLPLETEGAAQRLQPQKQPDIPTQEPLARKEEIKNLLEEYTNDEASRERPREEAAGPKEVKPLSAPFTAPGGTPQDAVATKPSNGSPGVRGDIKEQIFPEPEIKKDFMEEPTARQIQPTDISPAAPPSPAAAEGTPPINLPGAGEEKTPTPDMAPGTMPEMTPDGEEISTETPEELLAEIDKAEKEEGIDLSAPIGVPEAVIKDKKEEVKEIKPPTPPKKETKDEIKPGKEGRSSSKLFMLLGVLFITVIASGGAFYYFRILTPSEEAILPTVPTGPPIDITYTPPTPIVTPDFVQELVVANFEKQNLESALSQLVLNKYPEGSITYIPIRLSGSGDYIDAPTLFNALGIDIPEDSPFTSGAISTDIMLYVYGSGNEERETCEENSISGSDCFGPRIGFVLESNEESNKNLESLLSLNSQGLYNLLLGKAKTPLDEVTDSLRAEYNGLNIDAPETIEVVYKNLPISTMALNYTIVEKFLVFATSKNSSYSMLDAILTTSP